MRYLCPLSLTSSTKYVHNLKIVTYLCPLSLISATKCGHSLTIVTCLCPLSLITATKFGHSLTIVTCLCPLSLIIATTFGHSLTIVISHVPIFVVIIPEILKTTAKFAAYLTRFVSLHNVQVHSKRLILANFKNLQPNAYKVCVILLAG